MLYTLFIYIVHEMFDEKKQQDLNLVANVLEWQTIGEIIQRT